MPGYRSPAGQEQTADGLANALQRLCRQYRLLALYVFGSRATEIAARVRGEAAEPAQPHFDVDVGVLTAREYRLSVMGPAQLSAKVIVDRPSWTR